MNFKKTLLLFLLFVEIVPTMAQSVFSLKGKHIILASNDITLTFPTVDKWGKYEYYTTKAFDISDCNKKHICKENIIGVPFYVNNVYATYSKKGKPQKLYLFLQNEIKIFILQVSLGKTYYGGFKYQHKFFVSPEHICIKYYDLDELTNFQNKMENTIYFYPNSNEKCTFRKFSFNGTSMFYEFCQGGKTKQETFDSYITNISNKQYAQSPLERCFLGIELEKDLINKCKQSFDSVLIQNFIKKFSNKEVYIKGGYGGYYQCGNIEIVNTGYKTPNYKYVMLLTKNGKEKKQIISENIIKNVVLADEYREEQRLLKEKEEREEQEQQAIFAQEEAREKARLIKKYGKRNAQLIFDEKVEIGFTKQMCIESWGEPQDINRTITRNRVHEQWVYGIGCYLYFEGNYLTAIQN